MALSTDERRSQLDGYAQKELGDGHTTRAQAFVNILDHEVDLVGGVVNPANAMIEDLTAVLVGDDRIPLYPDEYLNNRGQGPHYAGDYVGSSGFKPQFQEDSSHNSYQVQHAMAGIGISYGYPPPIEDYVLGQEEYPPDRALYEATFKIGNDLSDGKFYYGNLAQEVAEAIGDDILDVHLPPPPAPPPPPPSFKPLDPDHLENTGWTVSATDEAGTTWDGTKLYFTKQIPDDDGSGYDLEGSFNWKGSNGSHGKETFIGELEGHELKLAGQSIVQPATGLVTATYTGTLSEDGYLIENGQWVGSGIPGQWSAAIDLLT